MHNPTLIISFIAGAPVAAQRIVKFGAHGDHVIQAAAAADASIGVSERLTAAHDARVDVILGGVASVRYGGNVALGAYLTSDANGRAVTAASGNQALGRALLAGASGDVGAVLIAPSQIN